MSFFELFFFGLRIYLSFTRIFLFPFKKHYIQRPLHWGRGVSWYNSSMARPKSSISRVDEGAKANALSRTKATSQHYNKIGFSLQVKRKGVGIIAFSRCLQVNIDIFGIFPGQLGLDDSIEIHCRPLGSNNRYISLLAGSRHIAALAGGLYQAAKNLIGQRFGLNWRRKCFWPQFCLDCNLKYIKKKKRSLLVCYMQFCF